jgi:hypothetical protein
MGTFVRRIKPAKPEAAEQNDRQRSQDKEPPNGQAVEHSANLGPGWPAFNPGSCTRGSLEPHVRGTASVLAETGEALQTFPMDDREVGDDVRLGHSEIHGGANTAFRVRFEGAVMGHAAAIFTKVKTDARFAPRTGRSDVGARGTGKLGPVPRKVVSP